MLVKCNNARKELVIFLCNSFIETCKFVIKKPVNGYNIIFQINWPGWGVVRCFGNRAQHAFCKVCSFEILDTVVLSHTRKQ